MGKLKQAKQEYRERRCLQDFLMESNRIEGIPEGSITDHQFRTAQNFLALRELTVDDVCHVVSVFQPGAELRDRPGLNVRVGSHRPPLGSPLIREKLTAMLKTISMCHGESREAYWAHHAYEQLHPFTDGNGRSGRLIWLWMMNERATLGFLHTWYYQSLAEGSNNLLAPEVSTESREP